MNRSGRRRVANRELPMMPWFPGDFATATSAWTLLERAVYRELLDAQWILERLPTSPERLALIARCPLDQFTQAWETVKAKFDEVNGCLYNQRLEEHRTESIRLKQQKVSAGSSGGKASVKAKRQQRLSAAPGAAQAEGVAKINPPSPSPSGEKDKDKEVGQAPQLSLVPGDPNRGGEVERVFCHWQKTFSREKSVLDPKRRRLIQEAVRRHGAEDCCRAIDGYRKSDWHMGKNDRNKTYTDVELIFRDAAHVEKGVEMLTQVASDDPNQYIR